MFMEIDANQLFITYFKLSNNMPHKTHKCRQINCMVYAINTSEGLSIPIQLTFYKCF